jgi:hypothetical protein
VYRPGHRVHYIQAREAREHHGAGVPCDVVDLVAPDTVVIAFGKARRCWHYHDLKQLREALDQHGPAAHIYEPKRFPLAHERRPGGSRRPIRELCASPAR